MEDVTIGFAILDSRTMIDLLGKIKKPNQDIMKEVVDWLTLHAGVESSDYGFFLASLMKRYKEGDVQQFVNEYNKWYEMPIGLSPYGGGYYSWHPLTRVNNAIDASTLSDDAKFKAKRWLGDKSKKGVLDTFAVGFYFGKILERKQDATARLDVLLKQCITVEDVINWLVAT